MTRDDAIPEIVLLVEAEVGGAVRNEGVELDERTGVEKQFQALPSGQLPQAVLAVDAGLSPTLARFRPHPVETTQAIGIRRHALAPVRVGGAVALAGTRSVFAQGHRGNWFLDCAVHSRQLSLARRNR